MSLIKINLAPTKPLKATPPLVRTWRFLRKSSAALNPLAWLRRKSRPTERDIQLAEAQRRFAVSVAALRDLERMEPITDKAQQLKAIMLNRYEATKDRAQRDIDALMGGK